ncbi:MAG: hypothetical protein IJ532_00485 [Alphaproteobacteria bacterium]|nr:hypothetical protein [Alphaproteobacteria bacterium]
MEYFINLLRKALKSMLITTVLVLTLWITLYNLTDFNTVSNYFWMGVAVCSANTVLSNLRSHKFENLFQVQGSWVVMAGLVLVLYHAGFEAAAVFTAAAILASPFFGATVYEGIVGFTLLVTLANSIP